MMHPQRTAPARVAGIGAVLLALGACSGGSQAPAGSDEAPSGTASAPAVAAAPQPPVAPAAAADAAPRLVEAKTDLYEFSYKYPAAAAAIPGLRDFLEADMKRTRDKLAADAEAGKAEAAKSNFPYRTYSSDTEWQVVADLPGWLSLSQKWYTFSGGAHGMSGFDTLVWNRTTSDPTQRILEPLAMFRSRAAFDGAVQGPFCDALDRERMKKRQVAKIDRKSGDFMSQCVDPAKQTVILGSTNGRTFDRIGVLVGPYEAGPYAEGSYDVTVPVTPAVIAALRSPWRTAFTAR